MFFALYGIAFVIFLVIDMIWLGLIAKNLYQLHIGTLLRPDVQWIPAIVFYLLFVVGLVVFVIEPSLTAKSWVQALWKGALFGLIAYATYDLTNLATLKGWSLPVTAIDLCWGAFVTASVCTLTVLIAQKLGWQ